MKKILKLIISIVLIFEIVGCVSDPESMKPDKLGKQITKIISNEKTSTVDKMIKVLPYMVDDAVEWDKATNKMVITNEEYFDYLGEGVDFIANIFINNELSEEERQEFSSRLAELINGKISENKINMYGNLFVLNSRTLSEPELLKSPDQNIGKWSTEEIKKVSDNGKTYVQMAKKFADNEELRADFYQSIERSDPLGTMVMWVDRRSNGEEVQFPSTLLKKLANNPLKVLSYVEFFTKKDRESFFACFPLEGDANLAMHFMNVRFNDRVKDNLDIYAKAYSMAANIAALDISDNYKAVYEEYTQYCIDKGITGSKEDLIKEFPSINYSGIALNKLLSSPVEALDSTYIIAISKSGSNTFNDRSDNYLALDRYIRNNSSLKEAPLEYAKYLIIANYKYSKTRYYYGKRKNRVRKLSGTLTIYDRTNGNEVAKIPFSSKKAPKRIYTSDLQYYMWPSMERVKDSFYAKFKSTISNLK